MGAALGSKVLSLRTIIILAAVFELFGALFLSSRISTGLFTTSADASASEYMLAMICVLLGSGLWISVATCFSLPITTTHSIIGSVLVLRLYISGWSSLNLMSLLSIVVSWIVSPLLGALAGYWVWRPLKYYVIESPDQTNRMVLVFPFLIGGTTGIMILFILYMIARHALEIEFPFWLAFILSALGAFTMIVAIRYIVMPLLVQRLQHESERNLTPSPAIFAGNPTVEELERLSISIRPNKRASLPQQQQEQAEPEEKPDEDESLDIEIGNMIQVQRRYSKLVEQYTFNVLVIVTSCCIAIAHGSNDIANCNGPLQSIVVAFMSGKIPSKDDARSRREYNVWKHHWLMELRMDSWATMDWQLQQD